MKNHCLVTVCNEKYAVGVFILLLSLRKNNITNDVIVYGNKLSKSSVNSFLQFEGVKIIENSSDKPVNLSKVEAIKQASDYDFVTYLDADCFSIGDINKHIKEVEPVFRIRFRSANENVLRFHSKFSDESSKKIPQYFQDMWKGLFDDPSDECQIQSTCVTNCFTVSKEYFWVLDKWEQTYYKIHENFIKKPNDYKYMMHTNGVSISDELALNAVLAYTNEKITTSNYKLNLEPNSHIAHFGCNPKPWHFWHPKDLRYVNYISDLFSYAKKEQICHNFLKWQYHKGLKFLITPVSYLYYAFFRFKRAYTKILR